MSFQLYTDRPTDFECRIELEGASVVGSEIRMVLEDTKNINYMFQGSVDSSGNCKIAFPKLKGLFESNAKGTMKLEVIADDVYFQPWKSDYIIETAKKVTVEVVTQQTEQSKPSVKVHMKTPKKASLEQRLAEGIVEELVSSGISDEHVLLKHKKLVNSKVREISEETSTDPAKLIRCVVETLNKRRS